MGTRSPARIADASLLLRLGRVSNLPTVWTNVACGIALAGGDARAGIVLLLIASVSATYVAGMMLNDAFDRDIDASERPERPIPSGEIDAASVFAMGFGLLAAGFGLAVTAAVLSPSGSRAAAPACAFALAAAVLTYDLVHKRARSAVLLMAACRALVYATAAYTTAPRLGEITLLGMAAIFAYVTGLTAVAAQENLRALRSARALILLAIPAAIALWLGRHEPGGLAFAALFSGVTFETVRALRQHRSDIRSTVSQMIAGICLLDAALIAGCGEVEVAVVAALGAVLTRLVQRRVAGT